MSFGDRREEEGEGWEGGGGGKGEGVGRGRGGKGEGVGRGRGGKGEEGGICVYRITVSINYKQGPKPYDSLL